MTVACAWILSEQHTGVPAWSSQPYFCLSYETFASGKAVVSLRGVGCRPADLRPISTAAHRGAAIRNGLIIEYASKSVGVYRAADAIMEGHTGIIWVWFTVCHLQNGRVLNTVIPFPRTAEVEHVAYLSDPNGRSRLLASWITDMIDTY